MNPQEFQSLYDAHFRVVNGVLRHYAITTEEREDIIQTAFFTFWVYSQTVTVDKPCAFLVTSARNAAVSLLRQRKTRRSDSLESHAEPDSHALPSGNSDGAKAQELRERKIAVVRTALAEHTRKSGNDTLWKRYAEGCRLRDIAHERKEPLGTICARVNASRLPRRLTESLRAEVARINQEAEAY